jgi:hypothetical protein
LIVMIFTEFNEFTIHKERGHVFTCIFNPHKGWFYLLFYRCKNLGLREVERLGQGRVTNSPGLTWTENSTSRAILSPGNSWLSNVM